MTDAPMTPIAGYRPQSAANILLVNANKHTEEVILSQLDQMAALPDIDPRWLAIGRAHIEQGFMAINRSIMKPGRIKTGPAEIEALKAQQAALQSDTGL